MKNLIFKYYEDILPIGCCTDQIYAILMDDHSNNALKKVSSSPESWLMVPFIKTEINSYSIDMIEDTNRTRCYQSVLDETKYVIDKPLNPFDIRRFTIEYWRKETANKSRAVDILLKTEDIYHDGINWFNSNLGVTQIESVKQIQPKASVAFDSTNQLFRIIAFLEESGRLIENTTKCYIYIYDFNGNELFSTSSSYFIPNAKGVFKFEIPVNDISPDNIYTVLLDIVSDSVKYRSVNPIVSYD